MIYTLVKGEKSFLYSGTVSIVGITQIFLTCPFRWIGSRTAGLKITDRKEIGSQNSPVVSGSRRLESQGNSEG
jgi:hypothetical protein